MILRTVEILEAATDGLLYPSESDSPFTIASFSGKGASFVAWLAKQNPGVPVREITLDEFFGPLVDGYADPEGAQRFRDLRTAIEANLDGVHVYRVGDVRVTIYLAGHDKMNPNKWIYLKTLSVET